MTFALVLVISGSFYSYSQVNESAIHSKTQPKKSNSNATYLDTYIQQFAVQSCFLVSVIFEVEDSFGSPIPDAIVTFNELENIPGDYTFNDIEEGIYSFSVKKDGYISVNSEVIVSLESSEHHVLTTLVLETFTVTFSVVDAQENEITDAIVTFNSVENDPGNYIFEGILEGTYNYKVEKEGYIPVDAQITVSSDVIVDITLALETFTVTFSVVDAQENEITDAIVTFNSVENDPGNYLFEGILEGTYDYRVEKDGYIPFEDLAEVLNQNLTINVTLEIATSIPSTQLTEQWINLYPNPNSGQFTIELKLMPSESNISLTVLDTTGRIVYHFRVNNQNERFSHELQLSFLSKGMYYIHVQVDQRTVVKKLIIK